MSLGFFSAVGQTPTITFSVSSPACISESIVLTNSSSDADTYLWDFCEGDLMGDPSEQMSSSFNTSAITGLELINDGTDWYGFAVSFTANRLFRLEFGSSLSNDPFIEDLGNPNDLFDGSYTVRIVNEGGLWYGLVTNLGTSTLLRLNIGTDLSSDDIDATTVNLNGGSLSLPRGLDIAVDQGIIHALAGNISGGSSTLIRFPTGIVNDADAVNISSPSSQIGTKIIRDGANWYGFVFSGRLDKIDFGTSLWNPTPSVGEVVLDIPINNGTNIEIFEDAGIYYGIASTRSGDVNKIQFGPNLSMFSGSVTNHGNLTVFNDIIAFAGAKEESRYWHYAIDFGSMVLYRIQFPEGCTLNSSTSNVDLPSDIAYGNFGTFNITLRGTNATSGITSSDTQQVTVSENVAPDISFTSTICVAQPIQFTSVNTSGNIDTYNWDFGDGSPTSNDPNPTNDYSLTMGAGIYDVRLDVVSDEMCTNFTQQTIQIFNPPTADFADIAGTPCSGEALNFTNQSTFDVGSPITYSWDFNGEGSSNDANPTFTFQFGGLKDVTLTTSIPGCSDMITKQVNVQFGAIPDFSFSNICLGEVATFTDLSNGAGTTITDYDWDFGDGNTSTLQNPTNPYAATGDYNVSLTVTNNLGCSVTDIQTISVHANPIAAFTNDPACEGPVQFTDQTTVESANITQWLWDFDNGETATEEDPIANFSQSTEFDVSLIATSNFGCSDETSQTISVLSAPTPEFTVLQGCLGESVQFNDETIIESINPVTSYFWEIDDEVYSVMNPEHTFNAVGTFTARMTLTVANGCVVVSEQQVVVPAVPTPEFSITTACVNSATIFEDQSLDEGDPIISRTWDFDGLATANGPMAQFVFSQSGNYNISLTTVSTLGCTAFIGKTITVNEQPTAAFSSSTTLGPPPLSVNFTNQSEESTSYSWLLNDDVNPFSTEEHAALLFEEEGDFQVSLVSFNEFGCTDTLTQIIEVVFPATDLALDEVIAVPNNGKTNIVLRGANRGTLAIDGFDIIINIEDDITLIEEFDQTLLKNQPFVHTLNFDLQGEGSNVEFICIDLQLREVEEPNRDNNQQCINFEQEVIIQEPFPNPASENLRVNVIIPEVSDGVQITLMSIYGETIVDEMVSEPLEGLNIFDFNVNALTSGLYIVRIRYDGVEEVRRVNVE